jgi:hypothetical protein
MHDQSTDVSAVADFLTHLFAGAPEGSHGYCWRLDGKVTVALQLPRDIERAAGFLSGQDDTYYGVALSDGPLPGNKRIKDDEGRPAAGLLCLYGDVDVLHPCHARENLPPAAADALALIDEMPLVPTAVVDTGHGLQPTWLLKEAWVTGGPEERQAAALLVYRWQALLWQKAAARGWWVDHVQSLSQILRLPGTFNAKWQDERLPVQVVRADWSRLYGPEDFEPYLPEVDPESRPGAGGPAPDLDFDREEPTDEEVKRLLSANNGARMGWHRQHTKGDTSPSGQDWWLALAAASSGWPREKVAGLLLACRRANGDGLKHPRYYTLTAYKVDRIAAAERNGHHRADGEAGQAPGSEALIPCGPLRLRIDKVAATAKTVTAEVAVLRGEALVDVLNISPGRDSRDSAARTLVMADAAVRQEDARSAVSAVLVAAKGRAQAEAAQAAAARAAGRTLKEILLASIPPDARPDFRTTREQVWVESMGCEMGRERWGARLLTSAMIDVAASATDLGGQDGPPSRVTVIHACETELRVIWADWTAALPDEARATLGPSSMAAARWDAHGWKVMNAPQTFEVATTQHGTSGVKVASRASLLSRILLAHRRAVQAGNLAPDVWTPMMEAGEKGSRVSVFPCWWAHDAAGLLYIAIGWDLGDHCQPREKPFPGAANPAAFHAIGVRYRVFDPTPAIPVNTYPGGVPTAGVFTRAYIDRMLVKP